MINLKFYKNEIKHKNNFYDVYIHETDRSSPLHTQDFYEITLTYSDKIIYHINGENKVCPTGTLVFARPKDEHCWSAIGNKSFKYINLSFTPETFNEILRYLGAEDQRVYLEKGFHSEQLSKEQTARLVKKLKDANSFIRGDRKQKQYYVKGLLAQIFAEYFLKNRASEELPKWLKDACDWLKTDTNFACSLDDLAVKTRKSKEHLCRSVKKHLGVTAKQYVNDIRISYVASMLEHTDIPIIDLWLAAGFSSGSYFNKLFKDKFGMTAKEFRKHSFNA